MGMGGFPRGQGSGSPVPGGKAALAVLSSMYFAFGFITCLNDTLLPHLKAIFALDYTRATLIPFCFFMGYFVASLPCGRLVERFGSRASLAGALATIALGCLIFFPAAATASYPLFLLGLFVLASGITMIQVAGNPYVVALGAPETASSRLTLTSAFNALGATLAPIFGSLVILPATLGLPSAAVRAVQVPYLGLGALLLGLATFTALYPLPGGGVNPDPDEGGRRGRYAPSPSPLVLPSGTGAREPGTLLAHLRAHPHLALGALGIFSYVGAEVAIGSCLVNYLSLPSVGAMPLATSARYVSLYWGGAMLGRFAGFAILRRILPAKALVFNALAAVVLVLFSVAVGGRLAMVAILAVGLCNSILFPTVFTLALQGAGPHQGRASGILCMAVVGGAVVPMLQGVAADALGLRTAFLLPALCYGYIAFFGARSVRRARAGAGASLT